MVRILHVAQPQNGGVPRAIATLVQNAPDYEHIVIGRADAEYLQNKKFKRVIEMESGHIARLRQVRRVVRELEPDVVHAHSSFAGVYCRVAGLSVPVVYQPHCFKFEDPELNVVTRLTYRAVEFLLTRRTQAFAVLSPHEQRTVHKMSGSATSVLVPNVPSVRQNACDKSRLEEAHPEEEPRNIVLTIGRICDVKDPQFFVEVVEKVRHRYPDTAFVWIGDGEPALRSVLERHRVQVTGWLDDAAIAEWLNRGTVYLHTSKYEGFPLSVLEAASFHTPVIARAIPAFAETSLVTSPTSSGVSELLIKVLSGDEVVMRETREAEKELNDTMNDYAQREQLERLYSECVEREVN